MSTVSEIWVKINSDISGLQRGLLSSGTELKAFSATAAQTAGTTSSSAAKIETSYGGIGGTVQKLGPVFIAAGAAAVTGIVKGISATQQWAGEVKTLQRVTGQSAEDASRLATAANTLGISTSTLATSFGLLGKNIINGSANLEKYGVTTKDATGNTLPFNDILGNITDKFVSLPKGIEQATFAQNVFGRGGKALIPILSQGRAGLASLEAAADKYGTTLSQKDLDASQALTIAQKELGEAFKGAEISIGRDFIPVLTSAVEKVTSVVEVIHKIPQPVLSAGLAFVTLAGGAAAAGKVVGFLQDGWTNLGNTLGITSKVTETATVVLDENTAAVVGNTAAQGSWGVEVNSATNAISTASDVIDAGTKATEASTTAVVSDTAAQAAHAAAQKGTIATTVSQIAGQRALFDATVLGTGATGDAALAQTQLFEAEGLATSGMVAETAAWKSFGSAGVFSILNSGLASTAAVLYGTVKAVGFAKDEFTDFFRALVEHVNVAENTRRGLEDIGNAMRLFGFAVPHLTNDLGDFRKGVDDVQAGLQDGSISIEDAKTKIGELADKYGIANLNVNTFTDNLASQVGVVDKAAIAAAKHTRAMQLQGLAIGELASHSRTATGILDLMGESAAQFGADARKAFLDSDKAFKTWATDFRSQAVDAWNQFRDSARTSIDFTGSMLKDLESSVTAAQQALAGDTSGLGKPELASLRAAAHLTATDILHTFQAAKAQTVSFSRDLIEIGKVGGQAGKDLAASFLAAGDTLAAQVVADAPKKLQDKIVGAFGASEHAADSFSTKLTNAIVGPLDDISGLLEAIAKHFGIDVSFLDHGSQKKADSLKTTLDSIAKHHRGEIDLDTTQAMAALANLIAREHQAFSDGSGPVSVHQVHEGGLIMHTGGMASRMHSGRLAADEVPTVLQRGEFVIRKHAAAALGTSTLRSLNRMHAGGAVTRMHSDGAAAASSEDPNAGLTWGPRPVPSRNGKMFLDWTGPIARGMSPGNAMNFWNLRIGRRVISPSGDPTVRVSADLPSDYVDQTAQAITTNDMRRIRFRHPVRTSQAWQATNTWVLEHELGHALGLGHVGARYNIMSHPTLGRQVSSAQLAVVRQLWPGGTKLHAVGAVKRMHAGGAALAADTATATSSYGVRPPPTRNGQMWMGWTGGSDNAHPVRAMGWWNDRLNGRYVQQHANPSLHVAADLGPTMSKEYLGYTDFNLRNVHLNPIIKTVQDPAWNRVLRHEMGHGFGLGHVTNPNNLMDRDLTGDAIDATQAKQIKKWFHPPTMHAGGLAADEVPAILQTGEFVIRRQAVEHIGVPKLRELNRLHEGGPVTSSPLTRDGSDEAALERAFRKALRAELPGALLNQRVKLNVDRRKLSRSLDDDLLSDGHW
jgi:TP901 family phage tail tape measure protein